MVRQETRSINSRESRRETETVKDRFTRKLIEMQETEHEVHNCRDLLKKLTAKHAQLQKWVKTKMFEKAKGEKTQKVQVAYGNTVYTLNTKQRYKGSAPGKKKILGIIENFFNENDLCEFMASPSSVKAKNLHDYIYSDEVRGYVNRSQFSRRSIIPLKKPSKKK